MHGSRGSAQLFSHYFMHGIMHGVLVLVLLLLLGISGGKPAGAQPPTRTRTPNIPVPLYPWVSRGMGNYRGTVWVKGMERIHVPAELNCM
jgi:hypothetical protein